MTNTYYIIYVPKSAHSSVYIHYTYNDTIYTTSILSSKKI